MSDDITPGTQTPAPAPAPAPAPVPGPPTLHHLSHSQSQRVLWFLEELGIEYTLVLYRRSAKTKRAPPSLAQIHPLGKSPILVTASGRAIVETTAIIAYLVRTYDRTGRFASSSADADVDAVVREDSLVSFCGSSLGMWIAFGVLFSVAAQNTPWPLSYAMRAVKHAMHKYLLGVEFEKGLVYLTGELGAAEWFNGAEPGVVDVMLSWPFDNIVQWGWIDLDKEYPELAAWRRRVLERPAWKRGIEKGNGYDLVHMP